MKHREFPLTNKGMFRVTGILYLLVIVLAGFSQGFVRTTVMVPGDAMETSARILTHSGLFRWGLVTDLAAFILDAVVSVLLYQLLKPFGKTLAMITSALRLLAHPAIGAVNLLNHYLAGYVLSGAPFLSVFEPEQLQSLSLLFMDTHRNGYLLAGGFFGVHCLLLGILLVQSRLMPQFFGIAILVAGLAYLLETFGDFLMPGHEETLAWIVGLSAAIGEVGFTLYLIIRGARHSFFQPLNNVTG
ncbi:MAG: DUF4386 domain-containing protein [Saprospiraceae bacterium]